MAERNRPHACLDEDCLSDSDHACCGGPSCDVCHPRLTQGQPESAPLAHEELIRKIEQAWRGLRDECDARPVVMAALDALAISLTALSAAPPAQPHPETLRAYVQHKPDCRSRSLRDFCRQHGGDGGINGCPACQGMAPSRSCTCGLNEALEALSYACQAADCRDCDSDYCECRCHKHAAQTEALRALRDWCDERRNAPGMTTLGMVQAKIDSLIDTLSASPAPHTERTT